MGTRAAFYIGDPREPDVQWIGTVAWDGYPDGDVGKALTGVAAESDFIAALAALKASRDDFCDPADGGKFPFPWWDDVFLTDCTYAFFDGAVQYSAFHHGYIPLDDYLGSSGEQCEEYHEREGDRSFVNVALPDSIPSSYRDREPPAAGTDSIMLFTVASRDPAA